MTCFYCKGNIESSTTTYMTDYRDAISLSRMFLVKSVLNVGKNT